MNEDEIVKMLERMDSGKLGMRVEGESWDEVYAGNVTFVNDDGYTVVVFNDRDSFDYVDHILDPHGVKIWEFPDYDPAKPNELPFMSSKVASWRPPGEDTRWSGRSRAPISAERVEAAFRHLCEWMRGK